jgi:hypothetical protein
MDLKRLVTHFAYKIEPKREGGFIARVADPAVPALEASMREELQQKIQQNILGALSREFPGLKLPTDSKTVVSFHVERTPGGGFAIHSSDPNRGVIETADATEFESRFAEKFLGLAGRHMVPKMMKVLAAKAGSTNVKIEINGKTLFQTSFNTVSSSPVQSASTEVSKLTGGNASLTQFGGTLGNNPITPEPSNVGKVLGIIVTVLVLSGLRYLLLLHYR